MDAKEFGVSYYAKQLQEGLLRTDRQRSPITPQQDRTDLLGSGPGYRQGGFGKMFQKNCHARVVVALAAALIFALGTGHALAEGFDESYSLDAESLVLTNLIGGIEVLGHDGSNFEIEIHVRGDDADRDVIKINVNKGIDSQIHVQFPIKKNSKFVYPHMGRGSQTSFSISKDQDRDEGWLTSLLRAMGGRKIKVSGRGSGLEVWADVTIKVPNDKVLKVDLGVGSIEAADLNSDLTLETRSGQVFAGGINGDVIIDTGSGSVEVEEITGNLLVDTGSGQVDVRGVRGSSVNIDTGSGSVDAAKIDCSRLRIDTGSGRVRARSVEADEASIDTGSGSVVLELDRMGDGRFVIDTGSGSIDLFLPEDASADIMADTGSGGIHLDVQDARIKFRERDEVAFRLGGGDAEVRLDTGSGSIDIRQ